ncbi:MAG TPA: GNAT family N-acetyltransferase, partial [Pilimelia sp.]|nr:GNAT family N-acetyltransferase [Pilimelia sp.]
MTPSAAPAIVTAGPGAAGWLADLIAHAFWELPPARWLVSEPLARRRILAGQFGILVDHALRHGHIDMTADRAGVAVWLPRLSPAAPAPEHYVPRLEAACGRYTDRFLILDDLFEHHHPPQPHHHLVFLAVHPERQRQGIGTALLAYHHTRLDESRLAAYLEAPSTANRDFYRRRGYLAWEPFHLPDQGPP